MRTKRAWTWFGLKKTFTKPHPVQPCKNVILRVHYFYGHFEEGNLIELTGEEARHAGVLRLKPGELVGLQDGKGTIRIGETVLAEQKKVFFKIIDTQNYPPESPRIHLAVSLIKDRDRMEWLIEKITELGIVEFTPLLCKHTEKASFNKERWEKIITASFKQCGRAWRPVLHELTAFDTFINQHFNGHQCIAVQSGRPFSEVQRGFLKPEILFCVGPEGDFTKQEVELAENKGFERVSLGNTRYRTETAGLFGAMRLSLLDLH